MIVTILSLVLFVTFTILSGFHFYWLFGGRWGTDSVFPTKPGQINNRPPPKFATLIVALVLLFFGILYLIKSGAFVLELPSWITNYGYWFIPAIFMIRAIGEFKYVGVFKKIKETKFAVADSKIFSPLCFGVGLIGFLLQILG